MKISELLIYSTGRGAVVGNYQNWKRKIIFQNIVIENTTTVNRCWGGRPKLVVATMIKIQNCKAGSQPSVQLVRPSTHSLLYVLVWPIDNEFLCCVYRELVECRIDCGWVLGEGGKGELVAQLSFEQIPSNNN